MKKRIIGLLLALALFLNPFGYSVANAASTMNVETMEFDFDGKRYELEKQSFGKVQVAKISSSELETALEYTIYDDHFVVSYAGETYSVSKKDVSTSRESTWGDSVKSGYNRSGANTAVASTYASSVKYGGKTYSKYDDRYYYSWGATATRDFIKIGCNLNYEICYNYLSDVRRENVQKYITCIDESNDHFELAVAAVGAEMVAAIVGMGGAAIALAVVAPQALIVSLVALGFTGTIASAGTAIAEVFASKSDFDKAKDMYEVIKLYGTQV